MRITNIANILACRYRDLTVFIAAVNESVNSCMKRYSIRGFAFCEMEGGPSFRVCDPDWIAFGDPLWQCSANNPTPLLRLALSLSCYCRFLAALGMTERETGRERETERARVETPIHFGDVPQTTLRRCRG